MNRKANAGSAMIAVLCIMLVAASICLAVLYSSSVLMRSAVRYGENVQSQINVISVSKVLVEAIESLEFDGRGLAEHEDEWYLDQDLEILEMAVDLRVNEPENPSVFWLESDTLPGETVVELYWTDTGRDAPDEQNSNDFVLYLKITSTVGSKSNTVTRRFVPIIVPEDGAGSGEEIELENDVGGEEAVELEDDVGGEEAVELEESSWKWKCVDYGWEVR